MCRIAPDAATLIAAKRMGFSRRGANVDAAFSYALEQLQQSGLLLENEGKLTTVEIVFANLRG